MNEITNKLIELIDNFIAKYHCEPESIFLGNLIYHKLVFERIYNTSNEPTIPFFNGIRVRVLKDSKYLISFGLMETNEI